MKTPIKIEDSNILKSFDIKSELKLKKLSFLRKINSKIEFIHEEIVVAIGIIINPTFLKKITLTRMFNNIENKEI
tara:strand:+ start:489 stop:713 length:225 start_codon:yes stop_codon:yes gene_type:complete